MSKRFVLRFMSFLIICLALVPAQAQQTAFTFQGKLSDGGNPANGNYDLTFQLFDTQVVGTGTQQGVTLNLTSVPVTGGVFTAQLDFGACPSCFNGASRFLEIAVRPSGGSSFTTLSPRQEITATPYALKSTSAVTAEGLSVTCVSCVTSSQIQSVQASQVTGNIAGNQISGTIPLASMPPGSSNYVQNSSTQQPGTNFNVSGNGTAAGTLSGNVVNAATQYNLGGQRVLKSDLANQNTFLGVGAGGHQTNGVQNAFFGDAAGLNNTSGADNSFFGSLSGTTNTTGYGNSFFGVEAGSANTTGHNNVFIGDQAGLSNTTGSNTTAIGDGAGYSNTSENNNTFVGAGSDGTVGITNATAIGANAKVTKSDSIVLGSIAGVNGSDRDTLVGIGTTSPLYKLDVNGHAHFSGNTSASTVVAVDAFNLNADRILFYSGNNLHVGGNHPVIMGAAFGLGGYQLEAVSFGSKGARFGTATAGGTVLSVGGAGDVQVDANGTVGGRFIIKENGNVGIGQNNPGAKLEVGGNIKFTGLGTGGNTQLCRNAAGEIASCSSSLRYKTDLNPFTRGLDLINRLQPVTFQWKSDQTRDLGLAAEDVAAIEPLLVTHNANGEVEGVKYDRLNVVLINAIKEQQAQIKSQEEQIKSQNNAIAALQMRLGSLEPANRPQPQPHRRATIRNKSSRT